MDVTPMTVLRGFLVVGGVTLAGIGLLTSNVVHFAIGAVAALLGAYRLWDQYDR